MLSSDGNHRCTRLLLRSETQTRPLASAAMPVAASEPPRLNCPASEPASPNWVR